MLNTGKTLGPDRDEYRIPAHISSIRPTPPRHDGSNGSYSQEKEDLLEIAPQQERNKSQKKNKSKKI
jgi:hypothetical protein